MAKKKKQNFDGKKIKINEEELSITKIGEMTTAEQSPFLIIGIFLFLLLFIFFLPSLVNFIKGDVTTDYGTPTEKEPEKEQEPEEKEEAYYELNDTLNVSLEKTLVINNFKLENNEIEFTITNNGETRFNFNKKNYFLELYTIENTLLERIILKKESIDKETSTTFRYSLVSSKEIVKKIRFVEKEIADYPNIDLQKNEAGEELLVCTKETETLTYKFQEGKLVTITDEINNTNTEEDDNALLESWKNKSAVYNNIGGISSTFIDTGNGFFVNTVVDLKNVKIANVDNENYYAYETKPKVVKFEMEARGFRCK